MAGTLEIPTIGSANSVADPKVKSSLETLNNKLDASNNIPAGSIASEAVETAKIKAEAVTNAKLANEAKPFDWYTPKSIATEETRENVAFGTLTTADEIKEVVLPANGLMLVGYKAYWKSSVSEAGRAAIFLGENQLKSDGTAQEAKALTGGVAPLFTCTNGIAKGGATTSPGTTGETLSTIGSEAGLCLIYAAAATYNVSIRFKATSGNVVAKERKLWVAVMGV